MWHIEMALTLDSTVVEGLRMREELNRESLYWPDSGILKQSLESAIDRMIADETVQAPEAHEPIDKTAAVTAQ